jgi:hypothetical protein
MLEFEHVLIFFLLELNTQHAFKKFLHHLRGLSVS